MKINSESIGVPYKDLELSRHSIRLLKAMGLYEARHGDYDFLGDVDDMVKEIHEKYGLPHGNTYTAVLCYGVHLVQNYNDLGFKQSEHSIHNEKSEVRIFTGRGEYNEKGYIEYITTNYNSPRPRDTTVTKRIFDEACLQVMVATVVNPESLEQIGKLATDDYHMTTKAIGLASISTHFEHGVFVKSEFITPDKTVVKLRDKITGEDCVTVTVDGVVVEEITGINGSSQDRYVHTHLPNGDLQCHRVNLDERPNVSTYLVRSKDGWIKSFTGEDGVHEAVTIVDGKTTNITAESTGMTVTITRSKDRYITQTATYRNGNVSTEMFSPDGELIHKTRNGEVTYYSIIVDGVIKEDVFYDKCKYYSYKGERIHSIRTTDMVSETDVFFDFDNDEFHVVATDDAFRVFAAKRVNK